MKYTKIKVLDNNYFIGFDELGYTFIGSPNKDASEIDKWFSNNEFVAYDKRFKDIEDELTSYFMNHKKSIDIKMHVIGTDFQKSVWNALLDIDYGYKKTYLDIAKVLGDKKKVRAVASAIAKNPLLIAIPCHRVLGSDGKLRGFRTGLDFKEELLSIEAK